eukprot:6788778-Karenia_brevis.AAC.1
MAHNAVPLHMPSTNKASPLQYSTLGATGTPNPGGGNAAGMLPKWGHGMMPVGFDPRQAFTPRPSSRPPSPHSGMDWQGHRDEAYESGASSSRGNMQSGAAKGHRHQDAFAE